MAARKFFKPGKKDQCIQIPEWCLNVFVVRLEGELLEEYEAFIEKYSHTIKDKNDAAIVLLSYCCIDHHGGRVLSDTAVLKKRSKVVLDRLIAIVLEKNEKHVYKVEEVKKNLQPSTESKQNDSKPESGKKPARSNGKSGKSKQAGSDTIDGSDATEGSGSTKDDQGADKGGDTISTGSTD